MMHICILTLSLTHKLFHSTLLSLQQLMRLSLEQEKQSKIEAKERIEKNAADAVADQIRADEEAKEAKPKKKKNNKSKKKGKK